MISKWFKFREKAVKMRLGGYSIGDIEHTLGIPKSTLSGWLKNVNMSPEHKKKLNDRWKRGLIRARQKAVIWHNEQKELRLENARIEATTIIDKVSIKNKVLLEIALSMLYLGEGFKKKSVTGIGNSDPLILNFFIKTVKSIYNIKNKDITCYLHLRADQDQVKLCKYWSKKLNIPIKNFRKSSIDKRTIGIKTYDSYKGVCVVKCGNVAIQRKLVYLSRIYCEKIITNMGG